MVLIALQAPQNLFEFLAFVLLVDLFTKTTIFFPDEER